MVPSDSELLPHEIIQAILSMITALHISLGDRAFQTCSKFWTIQIHELFSIQWPQESKI